MRHLNAAAIAALLLAVVGTRDASGQKFPDRWDGDGLVVGQLVGTAEFGLATNSEKWAKLTVGKRDAHGGMFNRRVAIRDIRRIDYHYHAVVGFLGVYVLTARNGERFDVDEATPGFPSLWQAARRELPGLGPSDRTADIEAGDLEDSITVWEARA